MATRFNKLMLVGMLFAHGGCATQGAVLSSGAGAIRASATAADAETERVFGDINSAHRDDVITLLLAQKARPSEEAFAPVIPAETAARWTAVFDGIDKYLAGIQDLVDTRRSAAIGGELQGVGEALQSPNFGVKVPNAAVGLFASLGGALVQASAEKKAEDVMRRTDPEFRALMEGLAGLVGDPDSKPGTLRAMIDEHWAGLLAGAEHGYGAVLDAPESTRQPLLVGYGKLLDERQAYRERLERLRRALIAIGEAHSAAARGSPGGTYYWIGQINTYVQKARVDAKAGGK